MSGKKASVLKRQRQDEKRSARNKFEKTRIKTAIKKAKTAVLDQTEQSDENVKKALRMLDKAKGKNVIHKNTAARKKSRLAKFQNKFKTESEKST
ncbi:30S ribosomal protein S20 [bacterium]|nr:30S ribosomal protein S20 [bacterium]